MELKKETNRICRVFILSSFIVHRGCCDVAFCFHLIAAVDIIKHIFYGLFYSSASLSKYFYIQHFYCYYYIHFIQTRFQMHLKHFSGFHNICKCELKANVHLFRLEKPKPVTKYLCLFRKTEKAEWMNREAKRHVTGKRGVALNSIRSDSKK